MMDRRDAIAVTSLVAGLLAVLLPLACLGVNPHHDGIMLKPALDVLSGQVLFRDTFSQYGPLTTYLQVTVLRLEPTLRALRFMTVAAYAASLCFFYAAWRQVLPRSLTVVSCVLFILFIPANEKDFWNRELWPLLPWSSVFAMLFQSLGLHALLRVVRGEQPERGALVLGAATAGAFWCRQPVGAIMAGCLVLIGFALHLAGWTPARGSKRLLAGRFFGGFAAVSALLLGHIAVSGALAEWWYQNFIWPAKWSADTDWSDSLLYCVQPAQGAGLVGLVAALCLPAWVEKFRPALPAWFRPAYFLGLAGVLSWQHAWLAGVLALRYGGWTILLPLLVLLQAVVSALQVFTRRETLRSPDYYLVASLAAISLGSLAQYYPAADPWHVLWALAPTFGLVTFLLWRWSGWPAPVLGLALAAALLPSAWGKFQSTRRTLAEPTVTLATPAVLRGMRVPPSAAQVYGRIMATLDPVLRQQPDIPAVLVGYDAIFLCFMPNLANPTPYFVTWAALASEADNRRRLNYIQRVRPLIFFHRARWNGVNDFYRSAHYVPLLYVPEEALEIAVPQELAHRLGVGPYGAPAPVRAEIKAPPAPGS